MCYSIPGIVVELKGKIAVLDYFGERRNVLNDFSNEKRSANDGSGNSAVKVGDYAYAQGGVLIQKVPVDEGKKILEFWKDRFFQLAELDGKIMSSGGLMGSSEVEPDFRKAITLLRASSSAVVAYSSEYSTSILRCLNANDAEMAVLFQEANKTRQEHLKNSCCVHGIIEFSNHCVNDCAYCGIRKSNTSINRYRMAAEEIIAAAEQAVARLGFKALVLQSGEDPWFTAEKLAEIIKKIRAKCGVLLFMSIGTRDNECYKKMYDAGARGVLLRFETSNPELYSKMHPKAGHQTDSPKSDFKKRIDAIKYCQELGYIVATGSLIGLPGQTTEDIKNDILLAKELNAEMLSFGPFIPAENTPLENASTGNTGAGNPDARNNDAGNAGAGNADDVLKASNVLKTNTVLKAIAVSRLVYPDAKILVTTALETLDGQSGRRKGLLAGANSLMINITPEKYREQYLIYPGRQHNDVAENIRRTIELLYSLGRAPTDLEYRQNDALARQE